MRRKRPTKRQIVEAWEKAGGRCWRCGHKIAGKPTPVKTRQEYSHSQVAAILCGDPAFHRFLEENYQHLSTGANPDDFDPPSLVRQICGVNSRAEFDSDPHAAQRWMSLKGRFEAWKRL